MRIHPGDWIGFFGLLFFAWMIAWLFPPLTVSLAVALVVGVVSLRIGLKLDQRAAERQRLLTNCERQHRELMEGQVLTFGPRLPDCPGRP